MYKAKARRQASKKASKHAGIPRGMQARLPLEGGPETEGRGERSQALPNGRVEDRRGEGKGANWDGAQSTARVSLVTTLLLARLAASLQQTISLRKGLNSLTLMRWTKNDGVAG